MGGGGLKVGNHTVLICLVILRVWQSILKEDFSR